MVQVEQSPDPDFVAILKGEIRGMHFAEASKYDADKIKEQFPICSRDRDLRQDEQFMDNLMFIVRKREVCELRTDVERVAGERARKPGARISALKTWYACGSQRDRESIDDELYRQLKGEKGQFDGLVTTPALEWAACIGGRKTMELLKEWHKEVAQKQTQAEQETPDDHRRIGQLDQMRSSLDRKIFAMSQRLEVVGQAEVEGASSMAELYLRQAGRLGCWGYKELVGRPTPEAVQGVRRFVSQKLSTLVPAEGLTGDEVSEMHKDYHLRGLCLLQAMGERLNPREQEYFDPHAEEVEARSAYFRPHHDWEDVLD